MSDSQPKEDAVKTAGRGFLIITAAKVWFLFTGAAIQLGLPILFEGAEDFGVFKIITEAISLINMVMIAGTLQSVSKLASEQPERANAVVTLALKLQLCLGLPCAILYAIFSPQIAGWFNDPSLAGLMRWSSLIVAFYAFYAIFVGYLNGRKLFVKQAMLDIAFATMKTAGILGLVVLGYGVIGAVLGFVVAAGVICVVSGLWVFRIMSKADDAKLPLEPGTAKRLFGFLVSVMLYTFALNGLMRADLFMLKSIAADLPSQFVGFEVVFKVMSDKLAGLYGAVLNIARIPYQGVIAITFVIFPMISAATFADDRETTKRYITNTFRYCFLLIAAVALVLIFNSDSLVAGLYAAEYQAASEALAILSISIIFFAIFFVATTMLIGAGKPIAAVVCMGLALAVSAIANYFLIHNVHDAFMASLPVVELGAVDATSAQSIVASAVNNGESALQIGTPFLMHAPEYMRAAAIATLIGMSSGCLLSMGYIWKTFSTPPPFATLIRIFVATAVMFGLDWVIPTPIEWVASYGKLTFLLIVLAKMVLLGLVFLAVLAIAREFTRDDFDKVLRVLGRKKSA